MASKYSLLLEGVVEEKSVQLSLDKIKQKIQASGGNVIKFQTVVDTKGAEKATVVWQQGTKQITENVKLTNNGLTASVRETEKVAKQTGVWNNWLGQSIISAARYAVGLGTVYAIVNKISSGFEYIVNLNKELTDIRIVTGMSSDEVDKLAVSYNGLAKEMGATTIEVAQGSLEYIRQGKTAEETGELLRQTLIMSKLGNMETAESTEYLTSIMNGYKLSASEIPAIVDKIIQVDNTMATSTSELSEALQRSAVSAQQAGVEFEELLAMVGTISSVTRRDAGTVGTSLRTIFARFQDIQKGGLDEEGMGINNVDLALKRVGISIRDNTGNFREFTDVLDDLFPIWKELDSIERANIVKAMAGKQRMPEHMVTYGLSLDTNPILCYN